MPGWREPQFTRVDEKYNTNCPRSYDLSTVHTEDPVYSIEWGGGEQPLSVPDMFSFATEYGALTTVNIR